MAAPAASPEVGLDKAPVKEVLQKLSTNNELGLSSAEAQSRLAKYGPNALEEKKKSLWSVFFGFFWGPIPWMIEAAAIMSLFVKDFADFSIITGLLVFNAVLGFWQEHQASNALDALKHALALNANALRDGKWQIIPASMLVPGDIVRLRLGDVVPADCRLILGNYLNCDQSALTGESLPVSKKIGDEAYSGSIVKQGEMTAVIIATGSNTFFGRTAKLVQSAGAVSHFQKAVMQIGDFLIVTAVALAAVLVAVQLHRDVGILRLAEFVLILLVASVPVAMPAVLSMTMAVGARLLAAQKAIVSRLESIEELAGVDILFSDKTGTLTQNKLTLGDPLPWGNTNPQDIILAGSLASKAEDKDPIDLAIIHALKDESVLNSYQQIAYVPFDPVSKRTQATIKPASGREFKVSKGMPEVIFKLAQLPPDEITKAEEIVSEYALKGYRTLAAARTNESGAWVLLGILPMYDPPRPDSKETIARAQAYGVTVKMVTGDDVAIGETIAADLGLGCNIVAASDIFKGDIGKGEIPLDLARQVEAAQGFGRVFPEHKYAIVKAAQELGHIAGMTGDGVNDAPALKQADVGIAVSGATQAARAAAALILTAPGLSVIIRGIEEARRIFERMMSYTLYRVAITTAIMFFIVITTIVYNFFPLTPIMLIALALLDDVPIMTIAFDNASVAPRPVKWQMRRVLVISSVLGVLAVIQSFGLLYIFDRIMHLDRGMIQTGLFLQLVVGGHLMLLVTRSKGAFWKPPYPAPKLFWAVVATQIFAAIMAVHGRVVPEISWKLVGDIWLYCLIWMLVIDVVKLGLYRRLDEEETHRSPWLTRMKTSLDGLGNLYHKA